MLIQQIKTQDLNGIRFVTRIYHSHCTVSFSAFLLEYPVHLGKNFHPVQRLLAPMIVAKKNFLWNDDVSKQRLT